MQALVLERTADIESRPLRLAELPDPEPGPGEIRLRVSACGVCRTDLHVVQGDLPDPNLPLIPGHQIVGTVDARGEGTDRFEIGDRVGVAWLRGVCGECRFCGSGSENLCRDSRYTGYHGDGGYAELALAPADFVYAIPPEFEDVHAAPLLCAGIIGYRALLRARVPPGGRVLLVGFGSSAHVVLQIARARGHEVYVRSRGREHRELARRLGAAWAGGPEDAPPAAPDSAIVFAPAGEVVPPTLAAVRPGGTVALTGIHMSDIPPLDYERHLFHEKSLVSVEANTREDGRGLLREAAEIPIRPEVTTFPLEEANDALAALARGSIDGSAVLVI